VLNISAPLRARPRQIQRHHSRRKNSNNNPAITPPVNRDESRE
jgi:hypothetical protein